MFETDPTGRIIEATVDACPSCGAPWGPFRVRIGWETCHPCTGARYGGHRARLCWTCGVEHLDGPCDRLEGGRTRQLLPRP